MSIAKNHTVCPSMRDSLIDRQFELQSIERKVIPIPTPIPMQSMTSPTFLMAVAAVAMSVIAIFTVACVVKGGNVGETRSQPLQEACRETSPTAFGNEERENKRGIPIPLLAYTSLQLATALALAPRVEEPPSSCQWRPLPLKQWRQRQLGSLLQ